MFVLNNTTVSNYNKPYIVAELSGNHNQSIEKARQTIISASLAGANAIKLQTYTPDSMTIKSDKDQFLIKEGEWKGYNLYDLYQVAHTPYEWHQDLFKTANDNNITIFSTPFDEDAVDFLESFDVPAYKIASFEIQDHDLIKKAAKTKKPLLMSTGMSTINDISEAVEVAKTYGNGKILLFHCVSSYPTPLESSFLSQLKIIKNTFDLDVGLSDHTLGNQAAISAVTLGACMIEKHFVLNRDDKSVDSKFSIEPDELRSLVQDTTAIWKSINSKEERPICEKPNLTFKRSLYFVKDVKKGDIIKEGDIRKIRPGYGLSQKNFTMLLVKK